MAYKDITKGKKIGTAQGARWVKSEAGVLGMEVSYKFEEPSTKTFETLTHVLWFGRKKKDSESLDEHKEKLAEQKKRSMDTLVNVLEYNGSTEQDQNGVLKGVIFAAGKEVELVIDLEPGLKDENKRYPKILWVNNIGGGGSNFDAVPAEILKNDLERVGFMGLYMQTMKEAGKDIPTPGSQASTPAGETTASGNQGTMIADEDIPF